MIKKFFYVLISGLEPFISLVGYSIVTVTLSAGVLLFFAKLINAFNINAYIEFYWVFAIIVSSFIFFSIAHWYSKLVEHFYDSQRKEQPVLYQNIIQSNSIPQGTKELVIAFHNQISLARSINEREFNLIGRVINWISTDKPNGDIEMNSSDFNVLLTLLNQKPDSKIKLNTPYSLSFKEAEKLLNQLKKL